MKILYLHGLYSNRGLQADLLSRQGYEVMNPALPDDDSPRSVAIAQRLTRRAAGGDRRQQPGRGGGCEHQPGTDAARPDRAGLAALGRPWR